MKDRTIELNARRWPPTEATNWAGKARFVVLPFLGRGAAETSSGAVHIPELLIRFGGRRIQGCNDHAGEDVLILASNEAGVDAGASPFVKSLCRSPGGRPPAARFSIFAIRKRRRRISNPQPGFRDALQVSKPLGDRAFSLARP